MKSLLALIAAALLLLTAPGLSMASAVRGLDDGSLGRTSHSWVKERPKPTFSGGHRNQSRPPPHWRNENWGKGHSWGRDHNRHKKNYDGPPRHRRDDRWSHKHDHHRHRKDHSWWHSGPRGAGAYFGIPGFVIRIR